MFSGLLVDRSAFTEQMAALSGAFNVLPLAEALARLPSGSLPRRAVAVSFDDGYADNFHIALPILRKFGLTATFFIATDFLDGGCMFNDMVLEACRHAPVGNWGTGVDEIGRLEVTSDRDRPVLAEKITGKLKYLDMERRMAISQRLLESVGAEPPQLMMTSAEVMELRNAGMDIGAHTAAHPILAKLSDKEARNQIDDGRCRLEELLGMRVPLFAFPNGVPGRDYCARDVALVRELGFDGAVSTAPGCVGTDADLFQVPRIGPWDQSRWRMSLRMLQTYATGRAHVTC
jgi:peptidoglycan/xylan/chitin deacetylase (PgdA/CDA1 family)